MALPTHDTMETWKTKEGQVFLIRHLKRRHLDNIIRFLERNDHDWDYGFDPENTSFDDGPNEKYEALVAERDRRDNELQARRVDRQRRLVQRLARKARVASKATRA